MLTRSTCSNHSNRRVATRARSAWRHMLAGGALAGLMLAAAGSVAGASVEERLAKGDVVVSSWHSKKYDAPTVQVQAVIDAPPGTVWAFVNACGDWEKTMPGIAAAEEVSRTKKPGGDEVVCKVAADLPFPFSDLVSITVGQHRLKDGVYTRRWKLREGDYKVNNGQWTIAPYGDDKKRTLATYKLTAKPKMPLPDWLQEKVQRSKIPSMLENLRNLTK